jgi:hypothetical protein
MESFDPSGAVNFSLLTIISLIFYWLESFASTKTAVTGDSFNAIVGARFTGLEGEISIFLVIVLESFALLCKTSAMRIGT